MAATCFGFCFFPQVPPKKNCLSQVPVSFFYSNARRSLLSSPCHSARAIVCQSWTPFLAEGQDLANQGDPIGRLISNNHGVQTKAQTSAMGHGGRRRLFECGKYVGKYHCLLEGRLPWPNPDVPRCSPMFHSQASVKLHRSLHRRNGQSHVFHLCWGWTDWL